MAHHLRSAHDRECDAFVRELRQFHDSRGTPFRHPPRLNGREINLQLLYNEVTAAGGWRKVNHNQSWDTVLKLLDVPRECPNASLAIKHIYIRYLDQYEKIHFHGEDPDDEVVECADVRGRKALGVSIHQVPMVYNHQRHELTDTLRVQLGIQHESPACTEYDKLVLSLLSTLPNEVDFAINVCLLLSNNGHRVLHLQNFPRLLDLLVAQAGVISDVNTNLPGLLERSLLEAHKMSVFWKSMSEDWQVKELLWPWHSGKDGEPNQEDHKLFNLSQSLGIRGSEGQRVVQIAAILRNLSFEEFNISIMASSPICLKFLLLCAHSRWSSLRQLGFDTLSNLCAEIVLEPYEDLYTQIIYKTMIQCILADDRFLVIRGLEMLTGLCKVASNGYVLVKTMDNRVYHKICSLLTVSDIMLLIYALECLYHITELGRESCSNLCRVRGLIGILVGLLTLDAQHQGSDACLNVKLVNASEPVSAAAATSLPTHSPLKSVAHSHSHKTIVVPIPSGYQELDNETFACSWLKATYEISALRSVSMADVYSEYQNICIKLGKKGLIGPTQLSNYVRSVFPHVMPRRVDVGSDIMFEGIRQRTHPLPVSIIAPVKCSGSVPSPQHHQTQGSSSLAAAPSLVIPSSPAHSVSTGCGGFSHSPILKAQLSAPPRSPSVQQPKNIVTPQTVAIPPLSPPSSPSPSSKDSSSLIKSLLANKVNQNIQRQQQLLREQKQLGSSSDLDTSTKLNSKIRATSQLGAMLGHFDLTKKATQTPLRGPPSASKRPVLLAAKARVNGVQRIIPLDCSPILEQPKDGVGLHMPHKSCVERHDSDSVNCVEKASIVGPVGGAGTSVQCHKSSLNSGKLFLTEKMSVRERFDGGVCSGTVSKQNNANQPRLHHASSFTSMPLNSPSLSKCVELAKTQNSEVSLFSNVSPTVQPQQPLKHKGVLADLLDGKVSKDALFSMNGIIDKKLDKKSGLRTVVVPSNHLTDTSIAKAKNSCNHILQPTVGHNSVTLQSKSPMRNFALTNGDNGSHGIDGSALVEIPVKSVSAVDRLISRPSVITSAAAVSKVPNDNVSKCGQQCTSYSPAVGSATSLESILSKYPNTTFSGGVGETGKSSVSLSKDESDELIGFPRVSIEQLNQLRQKSKLPLIQPKRPSVDQVSPVGDAPKKIRLDEAIASLAPEPSICPCAPLSSVSVGGALSNCRDQVRNTNVGQSTVAQGNTSGCATILKDPVVLPVTVQKVKAKLFSEVAKVSGERPVGNGNDRTAAIKESLYAKGQPASVVTKISVAATGSSEKGSAAAKLEFICEWKNCKEVFDFPSAVYLHACKVHAPVGSTSIPCMWENCDQMERQRFSLMTHLQDRHCNESALRMEAMRRKEITQSGKSNIPPPSAAPPHPGYAPNAALHAIKRHALEFLNSSDASAVSEDPVTKSIRLTAALILRNLVINSPLANRLLHPHESYLATIALSNMESSRPIAYFLGMLTGDLEDI